MVKWDKIKIDYITNSDMSIRAVAKKYKVSASVVARRSAAEGWAVEKERYQNESVSNSIKEIMDRQAQRRARVERIADKLLDKLEKAVDELEMREKSTRTKQKEASGNIEIETTTDTVEFEDSGVVDRAGAKLVAAALKDMKEVQMLQSALEERKQAVQLEILEQQRDQKDEDGTVTAVFKGDTEVLSE